MSQQVTTHIYNNHEEFWRNKIADEIMAECLYSSTNTENNRCTFLDIWGDDEPLRICTHEKDAAIARGQR